MLPPPMPQVRQCHSERRKGAQKDFSYTNQAEEVEVAPLSFQKLMMGLVCCLCSHIIINLVRSLGAQNCPFTRSARY